MDARNLAYLDAMGIDVWQPRQAHSGSDEEVVEPRIAVSAGDGDILCIVGSESEASLKLAAGIGGAMRCQPVWAWPSKAQSNQALTIPEAVSEKMLTRILVFGENLAVEILGEDMPSVISTARVHVVPSFEQLAADREAKRILWGLMNENGIAAGR